MGGCVTALERLAPRAGAVRQAAWGLATALLVPALFAAAALALQAGARRLGWAGVPLEALALKATFSLRELGRAGLRVAAALRRGAVEEARGWLRWLCSRDPARLDPAQLSAAAVESLGENTSDSVVAPLLAWALLGLPGALAYRAANTLDARIGYHGRYEWLGKAAARLDDLWNLLPSRLTALLLLAAGRLRGADAGAGLRVLRRDRGRTESPNAGWPMAALAGLLGVALEKPGHYRLGDPSTPPGPAQIEAAWRIASLAAALAAALALCVAWALGAAVHGAA